MSLSFYREGLSSIPPWRPLSTLGASKADALFDKVGSVNALPVCARATGERILMFPLMNE